MPVTKVVMGPGSFEVNLTDDVLPVPYKITDPLALEDQAFGHVVIFPTRIEPADYSDTNLLGMSIFTGIYNLQSSRTTLRGMHASGWLGDPDDKGDIVETAIVAVSPLASWVSALKPAALHAGTYNASPANLDWTCLYMTRRKAIDYVVDYFNMEWQVTDDLYLNADTTANLYVSTPTVIATPDWNGSDVRFRALRASLKSDHSAENYVTEGLAEDSGGTLYNAPLSPANPYLDGLGNDVVWQRKVSTGVDNSAAGAATVAAAQINKWGRIQQSITCETDAFCPMADVECGDNIYLYDPDHGIYDLDRQVRYAGELMFPMRQRVQSITMQLRDGMGVCFRSGDGVWTDLSDHVAWETGTSRLAVGAPIPVLSEVTRRSGVRA